MLKLKGMRYVMVNSSGEVYLGSLAKGHENQKQLSLMEEVTLKNFILKVREYETSVSHIP